MQYEGGVVCKGKGHAKVVALLFFSAFFLARWGIDKGPRQLGGLQYLF
jgi:hypothetical protein